jgi:hypothetical protein
MQLTPDQEAAEFIRRKEQFAQYLASDEYAEKMLQRMQLLDAGNRSLQARSYIQHLCERPDDPIEGCIFFIENFAWSFDPRPEHAPHHLPFIMFEYQRETIRWIIEHIDNGRDGLVEKSRDMGASWLLFVWVPLWYWLYRGGVNFLVGSYKEALVDDRSQDSLFGKMDYSLQSLPPWMLPKKFNPDKHRTKLKLINPANGNQITGDTMNPQFGRGSRKTCILFDELGFWDYAQDAWGSAGDATSCRIANSTPHGYNYYSMLKDSGMDVLTLHWKRHPLKDDEWYKFECSRRTPEEVAQELDISYSKSRTGRVYPEWDEKNVRTGLFPYDESLPLYVAWDFGKTDDTAIIWAQPRREGGLNIVDVVRGTGKNIDFYVPFITGQMPSGTYTYSKEEEEVIRSHSGWRPGTHFGDPAGRFVNQVTDLTVIDELKNYGIIINFNERWKYHTIRKSSTKRLIMDGINLNSNVRTRYFDMCIINAAYPKSRTEGMEQYNTAKPKHDGTSHYRSALEYLALGIEDYRPRKAGVYDKFPRREHSTGRRHVKRSVGY